MPYFEKFNKKGNTNKITKTLLKRPKQIEQTHLFPVNSHLAHKSRAILESP